MEKYKKVLSIKDEWIGNLGTDVKIGDILADSLLSMVGIYFNTKNLSDIQNNHYNLQLEFTEQQIRDIQFLLSDLRDKYAIYKDDAELQEKIKNYFLSLAKWSQNNLKTDADGVMLFGDLTFAPNDDYSDMDITFKTLYENIQYVVKYKDFPIEFLNTIQGDINKIMGPTYQTNGLNLNHDIETIANNHDVVLDKK